MRGTQKNEKTMAWFTDRYMVPPRSPIFGTLMHDVHRAMRSSRRRSGQAAEQAVSAAPHAASLTAPHELPDVACSIDIGGGWEGGTYDLASLDGSGDFSHAPAAAASAADSQLPLRAGSAGPPRLHSAAASHLLRASWAIMRQRQLFGHTVRLPLFGAAAALAHDAPDSSVDLSSVRATTRRRPAVLHIDLDPWGLGDAVYSATALPASADAASTIRVRDPSVASIAAAPAASTTSATVGNTRSSTRRRKTGASPLTTASAVSSSVESAALDGFNASKLAHQLLQLDRVSLATRGHVSLNRVVPWEASDSLVRRKAAAATPAAPSLATLPHSLTSATAADAAAGSAATNVAVISAAPPLDARGGSSSSSNDPTTAKTPPTYCDIELGQWPSNTALRLKAPFGMLVAVARVLPATSDDGNEESCAVCGLGGDIVCCDSCAASFHIACEHNMRWAREGCNRTGCSQPSTAHAACHSSYFLTPPAFFVV